jgi:Flp pilus assembly protein TadB
MQQTTTNTHHFPVAETLWVLAGIILILAYGDALIVLALAFAIAMITTGWWVRHKVARRAQRNDAQLASLTHLRPAFASRREASARASWHGPHAA